MKYLAYARAEILRGFRYRANYWATMVGAVAMVVIQWSLWTAVYSRRESVAGIGLATMMTYVMLGRVVSGFLGEPTALRTNGRVWSGAIVHDLVKPVDLHAQLLFQSLGSATFRFISTGLPLLLILRFAGWLDIPDARTLGIFLVSALMGYVTVFSTSFLSGVITFHVKSRVGIDYMYTVVELFSGLYFPLQFFPGWLRTVANWLPFKSIHYIPLAIWSGITAPGEVASALLTQVIWTCVMVAASRILWSGAVRSLTVQGG
ncbi:MAG: ABC transporter permease [Bacillota bacterium]